jgi:hypothetical protein
MVKNTKKEENIKEDLKEETTNEIPKKVVTPNDLEWTDHVLSLLSDDEKISGNPTTDGLRRVFEIALNCDIIEAITEIVQAPTPENEKRATATHTIRYVLKREASDTEDVKYRAVTGAADVFWGNCDKIYRNYPVAVAETRAEGRALRRALKLRKVVAAEEVTKDIEDYPDANSVSKITNNQINFIDVMAKRLNINVTKLLENNQYESKNIYTLGHEDAVTIVRLLSKYQQSIGDISPELLGYNPEWK